MKVLVFAAHPDDEALGCGGTIARHVARDDSVVVVFMTDGVGARDGAGPSPTSRRDACEKALSFLGVAESCHHNFPDNAMDGLPLLEVVRSVEAIVGRIKPDLVYTHHGGDLNIDHRVTHQAVLTACRPIQSVSLSGILGFEIPSATEWASPAIGPAFRPDRFVDVSRHLESKLAALAIYEEEMRPFPHPRSPEAVRSLAAWRGACAGLNAAEAFTTIRWIER